MRKTKNTKVDTRSLNTKKNTNKHITKPKKGTIKYETEKINRRKDKNKEKIRTNKTM